MSAPAIESVCMYIGISSIPETSSGRQQSIFSRIQSIEQEASGPVSYILIAVHTDILCA